MTRLPWIFGAVLVALGLSLLALLTGFVIRPAMAAPLLALLPLPPAWATSLNVAASLAIAGAALGSLGVLLVRREAARNRIRRMHEQDRLRRVRLYREEARREPYIGEVASRPEKNALAARRAAR